MLGWRVSQADARGFLIDAVARIGLKIVREKVKFEIAKFAVAVAVLGLDIQLGRDGSLREDVVDVVVDVVVVPPAVGIIVIRAGADGKSIIERPRRRLRRRWCRGFRTTRWR